MQLTKLQTKTEQALDVIQKYLQHIIEDNDRLIEIMKNLRTKNESELMQVIQTLEEYLKTKRNLEKTLLTRVQALSREYEENKQRILEEVTLENYFNF